MKNMKFGEIKTFIESRLIESYGNEQDFKQTLKEFKLDVLKNKNIAKIYSLYDELTTPKGLNESEAFLFVNEGVEMIKNHLKNIKLPSLLLKETKNNYELIDKLVYDEFLTLEERIITKKEICKVICEQKKQSVKESVKIPLSSMIKVANQSLHSYIETLDESSKRELLEIIKEDSEFLEIKFNVLKEDAASKLNSLLKKENDVETRTKIVETLDRIKNQGFNQINYYKLKQLVSSL